MIYELIIWISKINNNKILDYVCGNSILWRGRERERENGGMESNSERWWIYLDIWVTIIISTFFNFIGFSFTRIYDLFCLH